MISSTILVPKSCWGRWSQRQSPKMLRARAKKSLEIHACHEDCSNMPTHVALLRGSNVGGKNPLPMKALAKEFVAAGCDDVRTFIQSGNVIFSAPPGKDESELAQLLGARLAERFGYTAPLVLRTTEELRAAIANNPYL